MTTALSARALASLLAGWHTIGGGPAYSLLADRIRLLILDGRIALGTRLPAERELATQLELSRTTVSAAYGALRETGYLTSIRGSGSVARMPLAGSIAPDPQQSELLDLSKATLPAIPAVARAAETAAAQLPAYLGESGFDPIGIRVLREALAQRYTERGLPTDADQIMVTVGAQHAIALIARTLLSRGDRALIENPTYPHGLEALRGAGARMVPISVTTDGGWDEDGTEQAIQRSSPAIGYLMPDHHNPTGVSMPPEQRARVLALAERHGTSLIADETMAELGFGGDPEHPPFAAFGRALTIGSVGKTVWGGLRLGWIRADRSVIQRLVRARFAGDLGTPILEQLIVTALLPDYDRILEERRALLRTGHDFLVRELRTRFPDWEVPSAQGGLTLWVNLGVPVSSQLTLAARNEGLTLAAGPRFGLDGAFERFLRIPFSYPQDQTLRAVEALQRAWQTVLRHPVPASDELLPQVI
ncbi:PLP-dependent aminotransferase family protein [Lysobacter korlensis]|uniref:PLP-dependent aminotransferase family protein n=1 Tax=Lysobacter korlensis TaxID=553636 RepID=A0ABV6RU13_9GAMM